MSNKNDAMHPRKPHRPQSDNRGSDAMVNLQKDRWELLNAYLDCEVTPSERKLVERWLREDSNMQCLYARLLHVRRGLQAIPVPASERCDTEEMVQAVCQRIDRRPQRKLIWVGAAIAACFGAILTSNVQMPELVPNKTEDLPPIRLDEPLLPIPDKANTEAIPFEQRINISLDQPLLSIPVPSATDSPTSLGSAATKESDDASSEAPGVPATPTDMTPDEGML